MESSTNALLEKPTTATVEDEKELAKIKKFDEEISKWNSNSNTLINLPFEKSPKFFIYENVNLIIIQQAHRIISYPLNEFYHINEKNYETIYENKEYKIDSIKIDQINKILYVSYGFSISLYEFDINEISHTTTISHKLTHEFENFVSSFNIFDNTLVYYVEESDHINFCSAKDKVVSAQVIISREKAEKIDRIVLCNNLLILTSFTGSLMFLPISNSNVDECFRSGNGFKFDNLNTILKHSEKISLLEVSNEKNLMMTVSGDKGIGLWNLKMQRFHSLLVGHNDTVTAICFSNDSEKIISADKKLNVIIWNTVNCTQAAKILYCTDIITQIIVTDDNKHFISASNDKRIYICDLENNSCEAYLTGHKNEVSCVGFHKGKIYSTSSDSTLRKWNLTDQAESNIYQSKETPLKNVITFNEKILALTENTIILLSFSKNDGLKEDGSNTAIICANDLKLMRFSKNGENLIFAMNNDGILKIIKTDDLKFDNELNLQAGELNEVRSKEFIIVEPIENSFIFCISTDFKLNVHNFESNVIAEGMIEGVSSENLCYDIINFESTIQILQPGQQSPPTEKITKIILNTPDNFLTLIEIRYSPKISITLTKIPISSSVQPPSTTSPQKPPQIQMLQFLNQNFVAALEEEGTKLRIYSISPYISNTIPKRLDYRKEITKMKKVTIKNKEKLEDYLVTVSADLCLKVWKIDYIGLDQAADITIIEHFTIYEHTRPIIDLIHLPNTCYVATASHDGRVILWNIVEKRIENVYRSHYSKLLGLAIVKKDETNNSILCYSETMIEVWDYEVYKSDKDIKVKGTQNGMEKFIALSKLKYNRQINENQRFICFGDDEFTFLHYYCYKDLGHLALIALNINLNIRLTVSSDEKFCNSPLLFALKSDSVFCVKLIIEHIKALSLIPDLHRLRCICYCFRSDLIDLIKSGSSKLLDFFESIFLRTKAPCIESNYPSLPSTHFDINYIVDETKFIKQPQAGNSQQEEILIEFRSSMMLLPMDFGTSLSVNFLKSILECKVKGILRSNLIKSLIDYKWNKVWYALLFHSIIIWSLLLSIIMILLNFHTEIFCYLTICLISIMSIYEVFQIMNSGFEYFQEFWNWLDIIVLVFDMIWAILILIYGQEEKELISQISLVVVLFSFIRGISCFRIFDETRYYIQLIVKSISDVKYFIIIYLYTTLTFAVMFLASGYTGEETTMPSFLFYLKSSYDENIGGLDSNTDNKLFYIAFMAASIINVTIMLNLLISILGDTFDNFQVNSVEVDTEEKLQGILEIEASFELFMPKGNSSYIHMCLQVEYDEGVEEWQGKIRALENKIEVISRKMTEESKKQCEMISSLEMRNVESMDRLFQKVDSLQDSITSSIIQNIRSNSNII